MGENYKEEIRNHTTFREGDKVDIVYQFNCREYNLLKEKYSISETEGMTDLDKAFYLLKWVNKHILHTGCYDNSDKQDALTLLSVAFDKDYGINCLAMSTVLAECLLAVHVNARVVYMMPKEAEDGDNHVVVEAFISELGKWIMLDPTYGSVCTDLNGNILSLYELRKMVEKDKEYIFSENLNYNGNREVDIEDVKEYYAKNLFFFRCKSKQEYGEHCEFGNMLEIAPAGFDVHGRMVRNLEYRIETYGEYPLFIKWKSYEEGLCNQYIGINQFYNKPVC